MTHGTQTRSDRRHRDVDYGGYNIELAFRLADEPLVTRRRRLILVNEALKSIADRDERLVSWFVLPLQQDGWIHVRAVVCVAQPGEAAHLSEQWMASAIAAANLAEDPAAARLPDQRAGSVSAAHLVPFPTLTAQVSADMPSR